ncbi:ATP nucleotide 3'-pyrophosphokinase [Mycobacteroides chelonae]|uniref:ATP nucleotide 3'-pyrophosphokinase n=1 Tax=Mycobacteroides chelonae TaxID=1774 RepID=UPI0008A952CD|nr:ATP nucleotide 3'-pyrophosphokinase [Mycobacteroides chelonae]OHU61460.1 ATP nucleotide 3'-pyrophosphokinase [Mycobacteroides chelonae]
MSLSIAELKKVSIASIRDIAAGLRAKAASMRSSKAGVSDLPHKGTWTGVAADNADHEIGTFAKGVGNDADAYGNAATKVDRAGDEFEGLKQLLTKLENEAAGKFAINETTGEVTPLTKDFNKADRDYIANTLKQLCAAGGQANDDLAAGIHATDASGATSPAGAAGALPDMPGSAIKPDGSAGALRNLAAPNPDGDPGATKAAAAAGTDTQANYKEWYPKNAVPVGDKNVDPSKLGGLGAIPGVRDAATGREPPAKLAPALQGKDVPAFKAMTREVLTRQGVPADQIEARVNAAVESAQNPHLVRTDVPSASPTDPKYINRDFGEQFNRFTNGISDSATKTVDDQIEQAKILTGQAGPGAPGVAEAWKELGINAARQAHELTTDPLAAPKMGIEQAKDFYNNPSEFIGKNIIHGTEALATGGIGGEAAVGARGLLGDLTGTEGRALTHGLDDATPGHHPAPGGDHHAPASSDHLGGTGGDHSPAGDHHTPLSDGGGWESPSGGASLGPEHNAAANHFLEQARQAEPHITQSLRDIVGNNPGSELTGLDYRLKAEDSFKQKLFGSLLEDPRMSIDGHLAGMKDSVRYTMQSPEGLYAANTQRAIDNLVADGYEPVRFKNSWDQPGYQGINSFWRDPATGQTFEVQFHTPSSFDAKMQTHPLYEQERLPGISPQLVADLQQGQKQIFDSVPRPAGSSAISLPSNGGNK